MRKFLLIPLLALGLMAGAFAQNAPAPAADGQGQGGRGGRGGWDPAQMQQRMSEMIRERTGATAEEWTVIQPRLTALMEKQRAASALQARRGGMMRGGAENTAPTELSAVDKAIESNDAAQIKAALEALRKARAERAAEVKTAADSLREVLSLSQEARLVAMGILE